MFFQGKFRYWPKHFFLVLTLALWPSVFVLTINKIPSPGLITESDYQGQQKILRQTFLYPNVFLARLFQNKLQIPISKFEHNLTAIFDPNNYFFGFHPREIIGVDNPVKFPLVSLPIFFFAILNLSNLRSRRWLVGAFIIFALSLTFFENYFYYDFLLYFPLAFLFLHGLKNIPPKLDRYQNIYFLISSPLILIELTRQLIIFFPK